VQQIEQLPLYSCIRLICTSNSESGFELDMQPALQDGGKPFLVGAFDRGKFLAKVRVLGRGGSSA